MTTRRACLETCLDPCYTPPSKDSNKTEQKKQTNNVTRRTSPVPKRQKQLGAVASRKVGIYMLLAKEVKVVKRERAKEMGMVSVGVAEGGVIRGVSAHIWWERTPRDRSTNGNESNFQVVDV